MQKKLTEDSSRFSGQEYLRYTRHLQLPNVGVEGQLRLKSAKVSIVGCGGLGAPVGLYLAAAGVGQLTLIDDDSVELSNLQRQISFSESDIGKSKAVQTRERLTALNSDIRIRVEQQRLTFDSAAHLLTGSDLIIDCSDNFDTRYAINDFCKSAGIAWLYASIFQFSGQCALFKPEGSCYRCLFPSPGEQAVDCNTAGVIGILPGVLGSIQALEAIKYLLDLEGVLDNELLLVETLPLGVRKIKLEQNKNCPACFPSDDNKNLQNPGVTCEINQEISMTDKLVSPAEFKQLCDQDDCLLIDVRNPDEHNAFNLGGVNIPVHELADANIPEDKILVFYCHSGARSGNALHWAQENLGNENIIALEGGVVAYLADEIWCD